MSREEFMQYFEAKDCYWRQPGTIRDWVFLCSNCPDSVFFDHTEVFKIPGGYIICHSPYNHFNINAIESFKEKYGYIESEHKIYNANAITFYKIVSCLKTLRRELKLLPIYPGILGYR